MDDSIYQRIDALTNQALGGQDICSEDGLWLLQLDDTYLSWQMAGADRIRRTFRGEAVEVCAIANVRSGNCSENCNFCSQSGHHKTSAPEYDYIPVADLRQQAQQARQWGASDFGIVSKGWGVRSEKEYQQLDDYLASLEKSSDIGRCASLGAIDRKSADRLRALGLENYHHNLETAASFFPEVCTTHSYQENIDTIRHARDAGLRVCAGGIIGMGESLQQRIELALSLRELGVESVPLNFLSPQAGTPFADHSPLEPREILRTIATYRYLLPNAEIRIAGGRQFLRDLQSMIFIAGASGIMIGDYLTTSGRQVAEDLQMLRDLGVRPREDTQHRRRQQASTMA